MSGRVRYASSEAQNPIQQGLGDFAFGHAGQVFGVTARPDERDAVGAGAEAGSFFIDVVEDDPVEVFGGQLPASVGEAVVGFHGKADEHLARPFVPAQRGEDVRRAA